MASCRMASAVSGFLLTPNVTGNASLVSKRSMVLFPSKNNNNNNLRLVVRAAEEAAAPASAITTALPEVKPLRLGQPNPSLFYQKNSLKNLWYDKLDGLGAQFLIGELPKHQCCEQYRCCWHLWVNFF